MTTADEKLEIDFVKWWAAARGNIFPLCRLYGASISFIMEKPPETSAQVTEAIEKAKIDCFQRGVALQIVGGVVSDQRFMLMFTAMEQPNLPGFER